MAPRPLGRPRRVFEDRTKCGNEVVVSAAVQVIDGHAAMLVGILRRALARAESKARCTTIATRSMARRAVGRNDLRKEGHEKVTGRARYIDDIRFDNVLYVRTIRSTVPAGEITGIRYNFDLAGFTVVDHRDIPGQNVVA